jgi:hypothetical protein
MVGRCERCNRGHRRRGTTGDDETQCGHLSI